MAGDESLATLGGLVQPAQRFHVPGRGRLGPSLVDLLEPGTAVASIVLARTPDRIADPPNVAAVVFFDDGQMTGAKYSQRDRPRNAAVEAGSVI
ncbi:hypothetical protein [Azohydromonas sediminis]|uniref:hypothetical protein n=1 Tax=Azohydromonas sediminis TaxID=2259674 RepID=UPI001F2A1232|nr:hypothetical protein [Azohydromonas sediminis]